MRFARRVRPGPVAASDQLSNSSPILAQHLVSPIVVLLLREPRDSPGASGPRHCPCHHGQHRACKWATSVNPFP